jgi:hypothetical protein
MKNVLADENGSRLRDHGEFLDPGALNEAFTCIMGR